MICSSHFNTWSSELLKALTCSSSHSTAPRALSVNMKAPRALKDIIFYHYDPSLAAAIVFSVAYSLAFIGTLLQFMRYRSWVWTIMVVSSASK